MLSRSRVLKPQIGDGHGAQAFVYRTVNGGDSEACAVDSAGGRLDPSVQVLWGAATGRLLQGPTSEQIAVREQHAYETGFREAESRLRGELEKILLAERDRVSKALEEFGREKQSYYQRVEAEVVRLSLAIARKILHREVQMDPLLLAGMVRVALDRISTGGSVRLRVPPGEVSRWMEVIESLEGLEPRPEVVGDAAVPAGECQLETEVGSTNLSIETQLEEIENGFFDLLAVKER